MLLYTFSLEALGLSKIAIKIFVEDAKLYLGKYDL